MKKKLIIFFSILCLILPSFSVCTYAENTNGLPLVIDHADLMTESEQAELEEKLTEISERQEFDVVVLTIVSLDGKTPADFADDYYDYSGYGYGDDRDGCLLLLAMESRDWYISTTGFGITALTDYGIYSIGDEILYDLQNADYYSAFSLYADLVDEYVTDAKYGEAYDVDTDPDFDDDYYDTDYYETYHYENRHSTAKGILISAMIALIIAIIVTAIAAGSYKPVKFRKNASNYLVNGSFRLFDSRDNFKYHHVTKTRINDDSSSSHGGGHSGGSSTHTSSSGTTHGGGGGKF